MRFYIFKHIGLSVSFVGLLIGSTDTRSCEYIINDSYEAVPDAGPDDAGYHDFLAIAGYALTVSGLALPYAGIMDSFTKPIAEWETTFRACGYMSARTKAQYHVAKVEFYENAEKSIKNHLAVGLGIAVVGMIFALYHTYKSNQKKGTCSHTQ